VPERIVFRIPDQMTFEQAAMIEPVSVAVHAVNITPVRLGDSGVVIGSGMVGLLVIQALKLAGCSRVIAVDLDDGKLELAKALGASATLNASRDDVPTRVRELTEGRGADVAMEVVGATAPIQTALASVRKGGTLTLVGNLSPKIELPLQSVVTREVRLQGSCASSGEYPECIDLVATGRIRVEPLITAVAPLQEGPRWFERLYSKEPNVMKVLLKP
jgi:L-iditol 2-dehydrogenase